MFSKTFLRKFTKISNCAENDQALTLLTIQSQILMTKKKPVENIAGKEENAGNQHFLLLQ